MDILYYLSALCLILFMVLATYDGFYLHLWKYELFNKEESKFEHKTHTIRAILFPLIVWFLFIENSQFSFWIGIFLVLLDIVTLAIDAYSEKDSRTFMNGLPRWEYIIHLLSNSFHFAAIMLVIGTKLSIANNTIVFNNAVSSSVAKEIFDFIAINVIPGSIVLALVHILLMNSKGILIWNKYRSKIVCC